MLLNGEIFVIDEGTRLRFEGAIPVQHLFETLAMPGRKPGVYGAASLFDPATNSVPAGLREEALSLLRERGLECVLGPPAASTGRLFAWELKGVSLHPFQLEAVEEALSRKVALIKLPCGTGKTVVALECIARIGLPTLVVVHRAALAHQFAASLRGMAGLEAGVCAAGAFRLAPVTVVCLPTLAKNFDRFLDYEPARGLRGFPFVIVDEAHHSAAPGYYRAVAGLPCERRLGLSGTPGRRMKDEERVMRALFGPPIAVRELTDLSREGFCAAVKVKIARFKGAPLPLTGSWEEVACRFRAHGGRNDAIVSESLKIAKTRRSVLVMVTSWDHGELLQALFEARTGRTPPFVTSRESVRARSEVLERFKRGDFPVLLGSDWINEGMDIPSLGAVVIAGGQYAEPATLQKVGRVLRTGGPEKGGVGLVVDFDDSRLHPLLAHHLSKRVEIYREVLGAEVEGYAG